MQQEKTKVADYTNAVSPILEFLQDKYGAPGDITDPKKINEQIRQKLCVSDVIDDAGKQYVDLVQEGGGVYGIALAGYTYILEKMGIAFMKMAGTSAGSINTLLLSSVTTKEELKKMKECQANNKTEANKWDAPMQYDPAALIEDHYYETRTEKLLEYLAAKNLGDLVDGYPNWRTILLNTFKGKVKFDNVKDYLRKIKGRAILALIMLVLLLISGSFLAWLCYKSPSVLPVKWAFRIITLLFIIFIGYLANQVMRGCLLYKFMEGFGINPGNDFEDWIQRILIENGINNVSQLKNKQQMEHDCFNPHYDPCQKKPLKEESFTSKNLSPAEEKFHKDAMDLSQEVATLWTSNKFLGDASDSDVDQLNANAVDLAKKIDFNWEHKNELAENLVEIFTKLNSLRYNELKINDENNLDPFKKEIAIVSSDLTNEIKAEFPAMHKMYWGEDFDISPAKYVRASMSIPFFFKPFQITYNPSQRDVMEQEWRNVVHLNKRFEGNDKYALMVDGGMLSNFPINIFYNPDALLPLKPTIGIKLGYEDEARSKPIDTLPQFGETMISTMRYFYDRDFMSKHNNFKKTVRSIDTGEISWLNFALEDKEKIELFFRGALTAAIFLLGNQEKKDRADYMQTLVRMGKTVPFKGETFSIYPDRDISTFQTEDNNLDDILFNWMQYKRDRVMLYAENNAMQKQIRTKASFHSSPTNNNEANS